MRRVCVPLCLPLAAALLLAGCGSTPSPSSSSSASRTTAYSRLSPDQASDIAIHALGLVGTPYRYGGNTPDSGFDCSGLIGYVYKSRAGVAPPRTVAMLGDFGQSVSAGDLRTGDLVIFGAGASHNIVTASVLAIVGVANRLMARRPLATAAATPARLL